MPALHAAWLKSRKHAVSPSAFESAFELDEFISRKTHCIPAWHSRSQFPALWLQENYGKDNDAAVAAVKAVYKELDLPAVFRKYEQDSYNELMSAIKEQEQLPPEVFTTFLHKIYKRTK